MKKKVDSYIFKVYSTTMIVGIFMGDIIIYFKDLHYHTYNDAWDNPFYNFIFFLLIGTGFSIVPLLIFYLLTKGTLYTRIRFRKLLIYMLWITCIVIPFVTIYNMVNAGYHRYNVIIYAVCFLLSALMSFTFYRMDLTELLNHTNSRQEL